MAINLAQKQKPKKMFLVSHREILIIFCAFLVLAVGWLFPIRSVAESLFAALVFFLIFPLLIAKFLLKEPLENFGLGRGNFKAGAIAALLLAAVGLAAMIFLTKIPAMRNQIRLLPGIAGSFSFFLAAELVVAPAIFFSREFFFRGFLQLGLKEKMGNYAIFLQAVLSALLFLKSSWLELAYAFFSALAAGFAVKFSRSIYYSFLALWIISLIVDIIIIRMAFQGM
jgi:membrane protease YdiL (CAAX protease family)